MSAASRAIYDHSGRAAWIDALVCLEGLPAVVDQAPALVDYLERLMTTWPASDGGPPDEIARWLEGHRGPRAAKRGDAPPASVSDTRAPDEQIRPALMLSSARYDLFLAHPSEGRPSANALYSLLQGQIRVFFAERSVPPGDRWHRKIADAQRESRATAILIARDADDSWYLGEEIVTAIALHRADPDAHRDHPGPVRPRHLLAVRPLSRAGARCFRGHASQRGRPAARAPCESDHVLGVTACAVTPDGRRVVSASADYTLKVWDLATGRAEATLRGHASGVTACTVTSDGRRVVSASKDRTLKVWDLATGRPEVTLQGHADRVTACAVTSDGRRVVSASDDQTLKVWDLSSGTCLLTHRANAACGAIATTATAIIAGDAAGAVWFLDLPP